MNETKKKIIKVANDLFALKGFHGTSIRDIAKAADVNISAVNYHFGNKEDLYWLIIESNHREMTEQINEIGKESQNTLELISKIFDYFIESNSKLLNFFKIILNDDINLPKEQLGFLSKSDIGPPGAEVLKEKILADVNVANNELIVWAVKMIFSELVHFCVMAETSIVKLKLREDETMSADKMKKFILLSAKSYLFFIDHNRKLEP